MERAEWVPNRDHVAPPSFMREMQRQGRVHMLRSHDNSISFEQKIFRPKNILLLLFKNILLILFMARNENDSSWEPGTVVGKVHSVRVCLDGA